MDGLERSSQKVKVNTPEEIVTENKPKKNAKINKEVANKAKQKDAKDLATFVHCRLVSVSTKEANMQTFY